MKASMSSTTASRPAPAGCCGADVAKRSLTSGCTSWRTGAGEMDWKPSVGESGTLAVSHSSRRTTDASPSSAEVDAAKSGGVVIGSSEARFESLREEQVGRVSSVVPIEVAAVHGA